MWHHGLVKGAMTKADFAKRILESFDKLPETEKREVASAILRLALRFDTSPLSDEDLKSQVDELFCEFDNSGGEYEA